MAVSRQQICIRQHVFHQAKNAGLARGEDIFLPLGPTGNRWVAWTMREHVETTDGVATRDIYGCRLQTIVTGNYFDISNGGFTKAPAAGN